MRVRVTVFYGDEGNPLAKETRSYQLLGEDEDEESFSEARDYLDESVVEPYKDEGHDLEADEDEVEAVGTDYLAAWLVPTWFDSRQDAQRFLKEIITDCEAALEDLE